MSVYFTYLFFLFLQWVLYCWLQNWLDLYSILNWYIREKKIEINPEHYEERVSEADGAYPLCEKNSDLDKILCIGLHICYVSFLLLIQVKLSVLLLLIFHYFKTNCCCLGKAFLQCDHPIPQFHWSISFYFHFIFSITFFVKEQTKEFWIILNKRKCDREWTIRLWLDRTSS